MKTQKKSKGLAIFALVAVALLAVGFALGVSDNAKLLTASVISGTSISEIQTKLSQLSETMAKNEALLNDLESRDSEKQDLETQISMLRQENDALKDAAFGLITALNQQPVIIDSTSSTSSGHSSRETCRLEASDCSSHETFSKSACACISIPPARPDPAKNTL